MPQLSNKLARLRQPIADGSKREIIVTVLVMSAVAILIYAPKSLVAPASKSVVAKPQPIALADTKPKVDDIASYHVLADQPRYITIQALGVPKTRVIALGLTKDYQIAAPKGIYDAGWYNASAKPGQPGAVFIYGHVSSWTTDGVFYNLKNAKAGDKVTIERGDGKTLVYAVKATNIYPYNAVDMTAVLAPYTHGTQGLNLMTCTGKVITAGGIKQFDERLVVFANLLSIN